MIRAVTRYGGRGNLTFTVFTGGRNFASVLNCQLETLLHVICISKVECLNFACEIVGDSFSLKQ